MLKELKRTKHKLKKTFLQSNQMIMIRNSFLKNHKITLTLSIVKRMRQNFFTSCCDANLRLS